MNRDLENEEIREIKVDTDIKVFNAFLNDDDNIVFSKHYVSQFGTLSKVEEIEPESYNEVYIVAVWEPENTIAIDKQLNAEFKVPSKLKDMIRERGIKIKHIGRLKYGSSSW